jgi:hypothetical protein
MHLLFICCGGVNTLIAQTSKFAHGITSDVEVFEEY